MITRVAMTLEKLQGRYDRRINVCRTGGDSLRGNAGEEEETTFEFEND
jgi:hypothetical protein